MIKQHRVQKNWTEETECSK